MAKDFLHKLIAAMPELIDKDVYYSPKNLHADIPCKINGDGTVSYSNEPDVPYSQPQDLIAALYGPITGNISFSMNLFLHGNRRGKLSELMSKRMKELKDSNRFIDCPGFTLQTGYSCTSGVNKVC